MIFVQENTFENDFCKKPTIFVSSLCINQPDVFEFSLGNWLINSRGGIKQMPFYVTNLEITNRVSFS